jgi:hypothetical protein
MLIHITDVVGTTRDIKEQQRINTCGVKDAYSQYVRRENHTNMDKSLPIRPTMWDAIKGDGARYIGFTLSRLRNFDNTAMQRVIRSMFLPRLDTLVVREYADEDLHIGTDLHVFSLV